MQSTRLLLNNDWSHTYIAPPPDIKPHNVLLSAKKDLSAIKLIDYDNSALLRKEDDKIGIKKGTPEYMAPEVHAGLKYDYKCDVWSCGVMAYQLLSNTLPFGDSREISEEEIALKVEEGKYTLAGPAWGGVSSDAKDFVNHLLVLRDKKRPSAEKALTHKFLAGAEAAGSADAAATVRLAGNKGAMSALSNFKK
jgi:serine/threonine protein kinase